MFWKEDVDNLIFSLKNVNFSYLGRFPALADITMDIRAGERIAIIGANGSGKSTLLQMLDGLIFADSGEFNFSGTKLNEKKFYDVKFAKEFRKRVGFVFQNPEVQLFCPCVKEDILFGPLQLGLEKNEVNKRLEKLVALLDLGSLLSRAPHQLSIGEKRKVTIASTLIINPEILILDEPTVGLDPLTTRKIIDLLISEGLAGKTVIVSTHDLHIVEEFADLVYILNQEKRVASFGATSVILGNMQLLQDNNLVHIHSHKHKDEVHLHPHLHSEHHV